MTSTPSKMRANSTPFSPVKRQADNTMQLLPFKIGLRYSDRDAESNYAFAGSALDDQLQVTPTGLGTNIKQKALAFDASYSQPFNWGAMRNEYVVGADYNHFKTSNEQGRARSLGAARDYRSLGSLPYSNILGNARAGSRGFARTLDEETLESALDTLSALRADGKHIGVISHIAALTERIPTQIRITPEQGGRSRIDGPGCHRGAS